MKTKLILGSLLALTTIGSAQIYTPSGVIQGPSGSANNVGIGIASPSYPLDVQTSNTGGSGIRLKNTSPSFIGGEATLRLDATTPNGNEYAIHSIGNGWGSTPLIGALMIRDESATGGPAPRLVIQKTTGNVGIETTNPGNKLSVETGVANDGVSIRQTTGQSSALRLENLSSGGKNWSLFSTGNGSSQGSGNFSIYDNTAGVDRLFIDGATGNVGIGTLSPAAALHVAGDQAIRGDATTVFGAIGVEGNGTGTSAVAGFAYGFLGLATGGYGNYGGAFRATGNSSSSRSATGVLALVNSAGLGSTNYGIYASVNGLHQGGLGPDYAGYFDGDVVTVGGSYYYSDERLKKNVVTIGNSLQLINKLNPVNYNFDTDANPHLTLPSVKQYGFLSQEIEKILPELTKTVIHPAKLDEKGNELAPKREVLGLNYNGFIALLTKGMQEQQTQIYDQQSQLDTQKQLIEELTQKLSGTTGLNSVYGVETGFQMSQNEPNPFTHETVVKYTLPQSVSNAFMAVYDLTGKQITTFPIHEKGAASLTITSEKLAAGIYIYSIVADGKVVDSKRMIVAEK